MLIFSVLHCFILYLTITKSTSKSSSFYQLTSSPFTFFLSSIPKVTVIISSLQGCSRLLIGLLPLNLHAAAHMTLLKCMQIIHLPASQMFIKCLPHICSGPSAWLRYFNKNNKCFWKDEKKEDSKEGKGLRRKERREECKT